MHCICCSVMSKNAIILIGPIRSKQRRRSIQQPERFLVPLPTEMGLYWDTTSRLVQPTCQWDRYISLGFKNFVTFCDLKVWFFFFFLLGIEICFPPILQANHFNRTWLAAIWSYMNPTTNLAKKTACNKFCICHLRYYFDDKRGDDCQENDSNVYKKVCSL